MSMIKQKAVLILIRLARRWMEWGWVDDHLIEAEKIQEAYIRFLRSK